MRFLNRYIIKILIAIGTIFILLANLVSIPFWNITHESIKTTSSDLQTVYGIFLIVYYILVFIGEGLWSIGAVIFIFRGVFKIKTARKTFPEFKKRIFSILIASGILIILISLFYNAPFMYIDFVSPNPKDLINSYELLFSIASFMLLLGIILLVGGFVGICLKLVINKFKVKSRKKRK